jgi:hypothetical protein
VETCFSFRIPVSGSFFFCSIVILERINNFLNLPLVRFSHSAQFITWYKMKNAQACQRIAMTGQFIKHIVLPPTRVGSASSAHFGRLHQHSVA